MIILVLAALIILAVVGIGFAKVALFFRTNQVLNEVNRELARRKQS